LKNTPDRTSSQLKRQRRLLPGKPLAIGDSSFSGLTMFFSMVMVGLLIAFLVVLAIDAWPAIKQFGIAFLWHTNWNPVTEKFGAAPAIFGTLLSSIIALIFAIPISFGAAIYLVEVAPAWIRGPVSLLIELLAAIPSVIIGLWGLYIMVPFVRDHIEKFLGKYLGSFPLFHPINGNIFGFDFLSAGLILAIMIIPIITAVSRDALKAVPSQQREAMLALGATKWEMINRAVLPYCRSSLVSAVILGLGRAMGETMAVLMVIGNSYNITASLFSPGSTIASKIASSFSEASGSELSSLIYLALILLGVTLIVNVAARVLVWRMTAVKTVRE